MPSTWSDFWRQLFATDSGLSVFGFVPGILIGGYFYSKIRKVDFARLFDYVCLFAPLWLFFTRLGCFMAGCCFGKPMQHHLPWAVTFTNPASAVPRELLGVPLHPVQLYDAAGNLLIMAFLYAVVLRGIKDGRYPHGLICASYLAGYGALRFILEWFRADTQAFLGVITTGQALALALLALGIFLGVVFRRRGDCMENQIAGTQIKSALKLNVS